ncbi:hypothetical protein GYMLUDRAFT_536497 [Collybiopsis luxurians FD-317 M1]|nr:hypothetical protein GYMLUDRAFT_536497 [Collybiopsis luxurians FD-317 M1]
MLVEISRYAFYLQKQLDRPDRKLSAQTNTASGSPISATPQLADSPSLVIDDTDIEVDQEVDADTISERLEKLSLSTHKDNRHFGPSSNFVLVQTLFDYKEEATGQKPDFHVRRPQFWQIYPWQRDIQKRSNHALVFPEPDLLYKLVDIYFTRFEPYFPLLHRRTFERSIAEGLHKVDTGFGQVLLAVCAVASKGSDDPRNLPDGVDNLHAMGWRWYSQISVPTSSFIDSSISESAWILIGIGMRLAQAAGIHRKRPGHRRTVERELWIRAFWAIMIYDTFVSMFLGRPRVTTTDDFDAEYPTDCDQEFWENTDPENEFVQPSDKPSKSTFWIQFIKLMEIAGLTHRLIYPVRKSKHWKRLGIQGISWYQKSVMELDSALNEWVNAVPEHLKWDPNRSDDILFNQSVMLYSSYYWVQIQVHKSFIPRPDQNTILTGFPSLTICANAARSCIHIVEAQSKRWGQFPIAIPLGSVFTSAIMLLINFWRGKRMNPSLDTGTEMREVHKCFELLRPFEHRFQGAGRMM